MGAFIVIALGASMCSNQPVKRRDHPVVRVEIAHGPSRQSSLAARSAVCSSSSSPGRYRTYGWRATAFGSGVIVDRHRLAARARDPQPPRRSRRDRGRHAARRRAESGRRVEPPSQARRSPHAKRCARSAFWLISLGHAFSLLVVSAVNVHAITHMKEGLGYSLAAGLARLHAGDGRAVLRRACSVG